ncbi:MAG: phospho-N-acetylmuramoyl-pentapeptide-transferase [Gemmatimonadota bacterium]
MLFHWLAPLADRHIFFNLFRYITFRAGMAAATAIVIAFVLGPPVIRWLTRLRVGQVVRQDGPQTHLGKAGTPTMGGLLIVGATLIGTMLWADLTTPFTLLALGVLLGTGLIGFLDDYLKVIRRRTEGLVGRYKILGQGGLGLLVGVYLMSRPISPFPANTTQVPFLADYVLVFWKVLYVPWIMFILAGASNAVNLTDGLDGLAAGLAAIAAATFAVLAYLIGRADASTYLGLLYMPGAGELAIFCTALAGASLGFLWFNAHPAEVFMGDTGSLALGGAFAIIAVLLKAEFLLALIGAVFVVEALSVLAQVSFFKWTARTTGKGRRLLRMAPIHHHFEKLGWDESKIIARFWILGVLSSLLALSSLKIR